MMTFYFSKYKIIEKNTQKATLQFFEIFRIKNI